MTTLTGNKHISNIERTSFVALASKRMRVTWNGRTQMQKSKIQIFNGKKGDREKQTDPAREEAKAEIKRERLKKGRKKRW